MAGPEGAQYVVQAMGLGKRFRVARTLQFAPATSIFRSIFERAGAVATGIEDYSDAGDDDDDIDDEPDDADGDDQVVETEGDGFVWAVRDVSFALEPGMALGVLGDAGSGKSTLLRILSRQTRPTEGRAVVRGLVSPPPQSLATFMRADLSARSNLRHAPQLFGIPRQLVTPHIDEIVSFAGLDGRSAAASADANTRLRRLATAAVLCSEVDVMLFDELPRLADEGLESRILELISRRVADGAALVIASASRDLVEQLCTHVLVLADGRVTAFGDVASVLERERPNGKSPAQSEPRGPAQSEPRDGEPVEVYGEGPAGQPVGFNRWFAILGAQGEIADGMLRVVIEVEVAAPRLAVEATVELDELGGGQTIRFVQEEPGEYPERGRYRLRLEAPADTVPRGRYKASVIGRVMIKGRMFAVLRSDAFEIDGLGEKGRDGEAVWTVESRPDVD